MVSPTSTRSGGTCTTVHNRAREMIRSPESPASEFVNGACVLNGYGSALLVLAHRRENNPITIHRLGYRSSVIQFSALTLSCQLTSAPPRLAQLDPVNNLPYLGNPRD